MDSSRLDALIAEYEKWRDEGLSKGYLARLSDGTIVETEKGKELLKKLAENFE